MGRAGGGEGGVRETETDEKLKRVEDGSRWIGSLNRARKVSRESVFGLSKVLLIN